MSCMDWLMSSRALATASESPHRTPLITVGMFCNTGNGQIRMNIFEFTGEFGNNDTQDNLAEEVEVREINSERLMRGWAAGEKGVRTR
ncbi:hypothetical protein EYF80_015545 [Liparis tanakae]|uniref:Uncharacterized protein n=1 Tax=Liparis tanakae TaxID=230148 RepID=A0A4Z2IA81_9TELE|nr:hypothetical protein EYF80_015545 [Liparis tanakae]